MLTLLVALSLSQSINLRDEGVPLGWARTLDCTGSGITCSVNTTSRVATVAISGGGGGVPDTIPAVTYSATADLSAERVLSTGHYTTIDLGTAAQAQVDWAHGLTCSAGQVLTSASTSTMACTSTITASDVVCAGTCVTSAEIVSVTGAQVSSAVATATALAANPASCAAGEFVKDMAADGVLDCAVPAGTYALPDSTSGVTGGVRLTGDLGGSATSPAVVDDSHAHTASTISGLDVADTTTGTWSAARGGLGQAQPTCGGSQYLTCNGTTCSCGTPAGGSGNSLEQSVAINGAGIYSQAVTGQAWVTGTSKIVCGLLGSTSDSLTPEAIAVAGIVVTVSDRSAGVGFTLWLYSPNGLTGTVRVHCIGV